MCVLELLEKNSSAKTVCGIIEDAGYSAYAVGGCVRDALMGTEPNDVDITTSADPAAVHALFEKNGIKTIDTGIKHGTVTVLYNNECFEVTTMRTESGYADMRHPEAVVFVRNIEEDLARRDFTINAMAYSYKEKSIIDIYGGREDLAQRRIRCVGDPQMRFDEDALRIMRALRFSARLGFDIEPLTLAAMRRCKNNLNAVSSERIYKELSGILCACDAGRVIRDYSDILSVIIPELDRCRGFDQHSKYHIYDVLTHISYVVDNTPAVPYLRYAALFHDIGKPGTFFLDSKGEGHFYYHAQLSHEIARQTLDRLKCDNETKKKVLYLVKHHDTPLPEDSILIKKRISRIGAELFFDLATIAEADCKAQSPDVLYRLDKYTEIKNTASDILKKGNCLQRKDLAIDGTDIMDMGVKEGKTVGHVLSVLLSEVIDEKIPNERSELTLRAKQIIDES